MPYGTPKGYTGKEAIAGAPTSKRLPATGAQGRPLAVPAPPRAKSPKHVRKGQGTPRKGQKTV